MSYQAGKRLILGLFAIYVRHRKINKHKNKFADDTKAKKH